MVKLTSNKKQNYASIQDERVRSVTSGTLSFEDKASAIKMLRQISEQHIISRKNEEEYDDSIILWIRGFEVSEDELAQGYRGNFARLSVSEDGDGRFTVHSIKLTEEIKYHPQRDRGRDKYQMPNWGHPVLRAVRRGLVYATESDAQADLDQLNEQYIDAATRLSRNTLSIRIFSRRHEGNPVRSYILEICREERGYRISSLLRPSQWRNRRLKLDESYGSSVVTVLGVLGAEWESG